MLLIVGDWLCNVNAGLGEANTSALNLPVRFGSLEGQVVGKKSGRLLPLRSGLITILCRLSSLLYAPACGPLTSSTPARASGLMLVRMR